MFPYHVDPPFGVMNTQISVLPAASVLVGATPLGNLTEPGQPTVYGPPDPLVKIKVKLDPTLDGGFVMANVVLFDNVAVNTFPLFKFMVAFPLTPPRSLTISPYLMRERFDNIVPFNFKVSFAAS